MRDSHGRSRGPIASEARVVATMHDLNGEIEQSTHSGAVVSNVGTFELIEERPVVHSVT